MGTPEDIAQLEQSLNELIIKYEQFFLGLEKREPLRLLETVERLSRKYANVKIVNTMLKFKYNSLVARFCSYKQYWSRIVRLMEEGKYSRDRFRMTMHQRPDAPGDSGLAAPVVDPEEELFRNFVEARKSCSLPADAITREMVKSAIDKQRPAIIAKYGSDAVEFRVVIEDGVPKIRARRRKG
ncbi:hypothetical protein GURASL_02090 [Geotalea uraniireducens]|uniref:Uncharacterized protein n=1 Tax=Geotalea uraniireducens TaxID=351604 RepID=A0ABM8EH51_9BACT|nr:MXAN_5187 C-terminal domain-containing protein [Geotalea uraniireducens]BDV41286.1 hypothetical protein GURASL_02090 [Geotalea uraniireducens]